GRRWVGHRQYRGCAGGGCGPGQPVFMSRRCASSCGHAGQVTIGGSVLYCTCPDTGSAAHVLGGWCNGDTMVIRVRDNCIVGTFGYCTVLGSGGRWALLNLFVQGVGHFGCRGLFIWIGCACVIRAAWTGAGPMGWGRKWSRREAIWA